MTRDRYITLILSGVGLVTVVCGLILGGNPATARREQRDQERSSRLSQASNLVHGAYSLQGSLPTSTEAYLRLLTEAGMSSGAAPIADIPDYQPLTNDTYELCITFEGSGRMGTTSLTRPGLYPEETPDFWSHGTGRTCYTVRIPSWIKAEAATRKAAITSSTAPVPANSANP